MNRISCDLVLYILSLSLSMHKQLPLSSRIELLGQLLKLWRSALNGASSAEVTGSSEEGHQSIAMEMALEHLRSVHTAALKRPQECSEVSHHFVLSDHRVLYVNHLIIKYV